ncbi:DCC1-like thiol-disulfide oxidoreductase family protein [uncultured Tateyamaria sp.]|uniref:thiol-disulfide oxidoreductase DCC family protein n=1 Tax=uncultured Tateyamaria sp. TaxID=455651 RepID=UPI00261F420C|nr:DCC1-like thiol-disulfide oxidoreductase family protein [uncultured Tateyamaria sp.]
MQNDAIWLFDSQCVLCSWGVQFTLRHEKAATIRFVAIQSDEGRALARQHDVDPDDPATFLFIEDGRALEASDAVIALAQHLKGLAWVARLCRLIPRSWRDAAYRCVARNRYILFGQTTHCIVPAADQRHRFVL